MRVATKITLSLELLIVAVFAISAYFEITDDERTLRANRRSAVVSVAREYAEILSGLDPSTAQETLARSFDTRATVQARWSEVDLLPAQERVVEGPNRIAVYRTFTSRGGAVGELEIIRLTDDIDRFIRYETIRSIFSIAAVIVLGTLYSLLVGSRVIARPMRAIVARFQRVGSGDLSTVDAPPPRDEFGVLESELAAMTRNLAQARDARERENAAKLELVEQLQHAERLTTVGHLAAGMAHELGSPLNVISGYARLIATDPQAGAGAAESAQIIEEQTQRITHIVRQLLDFARRGKPNFETVDVRTTVERAVALAGVLANTRGVRLDFLPPDQPMLARIDDNRIQQVIVNVVHNAVHASPRGGDVAIRIGHARGRRPGDGSETDCVRVDVIDHGTGIPAEDVHRVFVPFFTTKTVGEGTGLGLSVSHGIVQEHGGWIDVASEVGVGSRFSVFLPAQAEAAA